MFYQTIATICEFEPDNKKRNSVMEYVSTYDIEPNFSYSLLTTAFTSRFTSSVCFTPQQLLNPLLGKYKREKKWLSGQKRKWGKWSQWKGEWKIDHNPDSAGITCWNLILHG